ncbi:TIGR01777 family oxidoreductase [Thalassotalea fusca]
MLRLLLTGGTGLIGRHFIDHYSTEYHFTVLTRNIELARSLLPENVELIDHLPNKNTFDVILNLAGEPIVDHRWSAKHKDKLRISRLNITQQLIDMILRSPMRPKVFLSGSAIGIYGDTGANVQTEQSIIHAEDFGHELCQQWESLALEAASCVRVVLLRTAVVLANNGGALSKMIAPFKFGLGATLGSGKQWMSWIHISDMVRAIEHCIAQEDIQGAVNFSSPNAITNYAFTHELAKALDRPSFLNMPVFALKLMLGERASLLLASQNVFPKRLVDSGFEFKFSHIDEALADLF